MAFDVLKVLITSCLEFASGPLRLDLIDAGAALALPYGDQSERSRSDHV